MLASELSLIDHLPGCIGWKDLNRHYLGANKALLALKGINHLEEIVGKTDEELSPGATDDNQLFQQQDVCVLMGETISAIHFDSFTQEVFFLEKSPLKDPNDCTTGLIYYCRPCHKEDMYTLLRKLDTQLQLNPSHYTLHQHENTFDFTNREYECVFLLIRGKSAKEIGILLSLSKRTVESYIENIKNKMNCKNKAEILVKAVLNGYHQYIPAGLNQSAIIQSLEFG